MSIKYDSDEPASLPPLSREDAVALCRNLPATVNELIERHFWLVKRLAHEAASIYYIDVQELVTEASYILTDAVNRKLDPQSENPTSYLWEIIKRGLQNFAEKYLRRSKRQRRLGDDTGYDFGDWLSDAIDENAGENSVKRQRRELFKPDRCREIVEQIMMLCDDDDAIMVALLMKGHSIHSVARQLGVKPTTIYSRRERLAERAEALFIIPTRGKISQKAS